MKAKALLAGAFILLAATAAQADPHIGQTAFSTVDGTTAQEVFPTDAAKIVLHVQLLDVTAETKIDADWIAEKTDAAPANYKIDTSHVTAQAAMTEAAVDLTKPDAGWPTGDYRVDLSVDGKPATSVHFKVAQ